MNDLDTRFEQAVAAVTQLPADPGNDAKLRLYGLYKQATQGGPTGKRPGFTNPVGRAKHDAWAAVAGLPTEQAKQAYIDLVDQLRSAG